MFKRHHLPPCLLEKVAGWCFMAEAVSDLKKIENKHHTHTHTQTY